MLGHLLGRIRHRLDTYRLTTHLEPVKWGPRMIQCRFDNVFSDCTHFITYAVAEGLARKIMPIKRRAGGFSNLENFKTFAAYPKTILVESNSLVMRETSARQRS